MTVSFPRGNFFLLLAAPFCHSFRYCCSFFFFFFNSYFFFQIVQVARETNEELRAIKADPADGYVVRDVLYVARRYELYYQRLLADVWNLALWFDAEKLHKLWILHIFRYRFICDSWFLILKMIHLLSSSQALI